MHHLRPFVVPGEAALLHGTKGLKWPKHSSPSLQVVCEGGTVEVAVVGPPYQWSSYGSSYVPKNQVLQGNIL
jgi:hypothetical protein